MVLSASGSEVHVWELATGRPVRPAYRGHRKSVNTIAITTAGDGRAMTVSGDDGGAVQCGT